MLNILQKNNLCNILVIVTRYFGGILLGTGGLVRAYSDVTLQAIESVEKQEFTEGKEFRIKLDYSELENLKYYARKNNMNITNTEYKEEIICNIEMKNEDVNKFIEDIEKRNLNITEYEQVREKYILI